ncbi:hypothetical protein LRP88_13085 [Fusarium phalaenopsidis]
MSKPCWECLKRRLVCDLGRPGCQKCQSRDTECPGYDKKPLKWLHPGQTRSKGRRAKNESNVIQLALRDTTEATTLFEAIEYCMYALLVHQNPRSCAYSSDNVHICPDLVANGSGATTKSPFIIPLANAPYAPATIRHCLVSSALAHRILQSEQGFEEDRAILASRLQTYRGAAIRHLACGVKLGSEVGWNNTSGRDGRDATLASMLVFLFSEQSFSPNWRQHCDAAHTLIDLFGGTTQLIQEWPWFNHLFRYFILIDIMGTVTAPVPEVERTNRQLEYIGLLPSMYGVGLWTSLPCPPELLADIILHQHSSAVDLLKRIMAFSVEDWAATIIPYPQPKSSDKTVIQRQSELLGWQRVAYIYQSAVALYCISALLPPDCNTNNTQTTSDIDVSLLQSSCRKALLQDLRDVASNPNSDLRKYLMWPTVIAGVELDADDDMSKAFILEELGWASKMFGTASLLVAQDLLKRIWNSGRTKTRRWDDLFDRPYAFVM